MSTDGTLAHLAVEYWKLLRAFENAANRLAPERRQSALAQARFSAERLSAILDQADLTLVQFEDRTFEANIPATPINIEDFDEFDELVVDRTVEPAVVAGHAVLRSGRVILAKAREGGDVPGN